MISLNSIRYFIKKRKFKSTIIALFTVWILVSLIKQISTKEINDKDDTVIEKQRPFTLFDSIIETNTLSIYSYNSHTILTFKPDEIDKVNILKNLAQKYIKYKDYLQFPEKLDLNFDTIISALDEDSISFSKIFPRIAILQKTFEFYNTKIIGIEFKSYLAIWIVVIPSTISPSTFRIHEFPGYNKNNTREKEYNIPVEIGTNTNITIDKIPQSKFVRKVVLPFQDKFNIVQNKFNDKVTSGKWTVDLFKHSTVSLVPRLNKEDAMIFVNLLTRENYKKIKNYLSDAYYTDEKFYIILKEGTVIDKNLF